MKTKVEILPGQYARYLREGAMLVFDFRKQIKPIAIPVFLVSVAVFPCVTFLDAANPRPILGLIVTIAFFAASYFLYWKFIIWRTVSKGMKLRRITTTESFDLEMSSTRFVLTDKNKRLERTLSDISSVYVGIYGMFFYRNNQIVLSFPCSRALSSKLIKNSGYPGVIKYAQN